MKIETTYTEGYQSVVQAMGEEGPLLQPYPMDISNDQQVAYVTTWLAQTTGYSASMIHQKFMAAREDRKRELTQPAADLPEQYRPFPTHLLPAVTARYVESCARSMDCDPGIIALPLMVAMGAAIGNSRMARIHATFTAPATIWGCVVAESGSMKSPARDKAMRFTAERQRAAHARYSQAVQNWEAENRGRKNSPPRPKPEDIMLSDVTVEALADRLQSQPRGVVVDVDELAGWFGALNKYSNGQGDVAHWLSMYDANNLMVARKNPECPSIYVPHAFVSLFGGIQPGILAKHLGSDQQESGLASRFLFLMPPRRARKLSSAAVDGAVIDQMRRLIGNLYSLPLGTDGDPLEVPLSTEAYAVFEAYHNEAQQESMNHTGAVNKAIQKMIAYAAKFALLIYLGRKASGEVYGQEGDIIDADSMRRGIELAQWFLREAQRVYAMLGESEKTRELREKIDRVRAKAGPDGVLTIRDWKRSSRKFSSAADAENDLRPLVDAGMGEFAMVGRQRVFRLIQGQVEAERAAGIGELPPDPFEVDLENGEWVEVEG